MLGCYDPPLQACSAGRGPARHRQWGQRMGWPWAGLPPLLPAGLCWDLRSCAWAASWHLCEGWLGILPRAEEKLPRDCTQAFLFSQKFQPFKAQGPERGLGLFQAAREQVFQPGGVTGPCGRLPLSLTGFLERSVARSPVATYDKMETSGPSFRPLRRNYF